MPEEQPISPEPDADPGQDAPPSAETNRPPGAESSAAASAASTAKARLRSSAARPPRPSTPQPGTAPAAQPSPANPARQPQSAPAAASGVEQPAAASHKAETKVESLWSKVWTTVRKTAAPLLGWVQTKVVNSKFYGNVSKRLQPLQPLRKGVVWLWRQVIMPLFNQVIKPLWGQGLKFLRRRFPQFLKPFSDRVLTGIILGLFLVIYSGISSLTSPSAPVSRRTPESVAVSPPPSGTQPGSSSPLSAPSLPKTEGSAPPPLPEEPSAPPEQKQIIDVQAQAAQLTEQFSADLVTAIEVNFADNRLLVLVSDRWFDLNPGEQDQLGADSLERSRALNFSKLEIRDSQNQLLAREPVVGSSIIILQRRGPEPLLMPNSDA